MQLSNQTKLKLIFSFLPFALATMWFTTFVPRYWPLLFLTIPILAVMVWKLPFKKGIDKTKTDWIGLCLMGWTLAGLTFFMVSGVTGEAIPSMLPLTIWGLGGLIFTTIGFVVQEGKTVGAAWAGFWMILITPLAINSLSWLNVSQEEIVQKLAEKNVATEEAIAFYEFMKPNGTPSYLTFTTGPWAVEQYNNPSPTWIQRTERMTLDHARDNAIIRSLGDKVNPITL